MRAGVKELQSSSDCGSRLHCLSQGSDGEDEQLHGELWTYFQSLTWYSHTLFGASSPTPRSPQRTLLPTL